MIPKLSAARYAIRSMVHTGNINKLKSIYSTYPHSIIKYGIIFWVNSSNSGKIFTLQTQSIRIMAGARPRISCKSLFKQIVIVTVSSLCVCVYMCVCVCVYVFMYVCMYIFRMLGISIYNINCNSSRNSTTQSVSTGGKF
jgi:hypothetical protein